MSSQSSLQTEATPQPTTWQDRLKKQSIGMRQAERLLQAAGVTRRGRLVERLVRKQQDGTLGTMTEDPASSGADDMIQVGDNVHHHYPAPAEASKSKGLSPAVALGLAALLGGGGAALPWLLGGLASKPSGSAIETPPAVTTPATAGPDSDTRYRLRLVD